MKYFFLIVMFIVVPFANATEITDCNNFEVPVNYDLNKFKYKTVKDSNWGDLYYYLMDSIFLKKNPQDATVESLSHIYVMLLDHGKAIVRYEEGDWERTTSNGHTLIKKTYQTEFETTWSIASKKLIIDKVGSGQAAKCYKDNGLDVYITYSEDMGPHSIKGRSQILHYGFSTYDPLRPL
jgi:hypothetical protein